jgi:hypothetical protein
MSMRDLLGKLARIDESMKSDAKKPTGPKFPGYWKGTDKASQAKNKMVGGSAEESIIRDLEQALVENPRTNAHRLMAEWRAYKEDEYGAYQPEPGAANQGDTHTPSPIGSGTNEEQLEEYGAAGTYGTASQAPIGTTSQNPDPAEQQAKMDQQQIQKNTNAIAPTLNAQGAAQPVNKPKFQAVMTKLDDKSNQNLSSQELQQLEPLAVAASKALQNPQTASQLKQVISKAGTMDQMKQQKVKQAQQQTGTNVPAGQQPDQNTQQAPGITK